MNVQRRGKRRILRPTATPYLPPPQRYQRVGKHAIVFRGRKVIDNKLQQDSRLQPRSRERTLRILITGYNKQISAPTLQKFIEDNCPPNFKPLRMQKFLLKPENASFLIKNKRAADAIVGLNGIRMGDGRTLTISYDPAWIIDSSSIKPLTLYVQKYYNKEQRVLDLREMKTRLSQITVDFNDPDFVASLLRVLKLNVPETDALLLDLNQIHTLRHMTSLHSALPSLKSLSLGSNTISNCSELDAIKDCDLINIILANNPVIESTPRPILENAVLARFTHLQTLDTTPVQHMAIGISPTERHWIPPSVKYYFVPPHPAEAYQSLIHKYFEWFDSDRNQIEFVYIPKSVFTLTLDQSTLDFTATDAQIKKYESISVNCAISADYSRTASILFTGSENIAKAFQSFDTLIPHTKTIKFLTVDTTTFPLFFEVAPGNTQTQPGMLLLHLQGLFVEPPTTYQRIFSRSLLLIPEAKSPLGHCVLNDHLTILPTRRRAEVPQPVPLTIEQQKLLEQLIKSTNLKLEFATALLQNNGWDPQRTIAAYQQALSSGQLNQSHFNQ